MKVYRQPTSHAISPRLCVRVPIFRDGVRSGLFVAQEPKNRENMETLIKYKPPMKCKIHVHGLLDSNYTQIPYGAILTWLGDVSIRASADKDEIYCLTSIKGARVWVEVSDFTWVTN